MRGVVALRDDLAGADAAGRVEPGNDEAAVGENADRGKLLVVVRGSADRKLAADRGARVGEDLPDDVEGRGVGEIEFRIDDKESAVRQARPAFTGRPVIAIWP